MNILIVSPLVHAINAQTKYAGIELLAWNYAKELAKTHKVSLTSHPQTTFPEGVTPLPHNDELGCFQTYQSLIRNFDVIHDFSHLHLAPRFMVNLPSLNIFWHAPSLAQYPKSPYNIIALSEWARREFKRVYRQDARYQQSICIDTSLYKPLGKRGDRFLTIGRMGVDKGNLNAVEICKLAKVPLDIVGASCGEKDYERKIMAYVDGENIKCHGEVPESEKIKLLQSCRGLIYATDHPEVTSHKIQEAMMCGAPVIVPALGAIPEIVTDSVDGWLCVTTQDYLSAIKCVDQLKTSTIKDKYSIEKVVNDYIPLYEEVANGLRWK